MKAEDCSECWWSKLVDLVLVRESTSSLTMYYSLPNLRQLNNLR